jgi:hypothetical protein
MVRRWSLAAHFLILYYPLIRTFFHRPHGDPAEPLSVRLALAANGGAWGSCAVVGSGGSLWRSGLGKEIDAHDVVLRVNQAPTVGYESHVGRRTHVRLLNNRWSMKYSHDRQSASAVRLLESRPKAAARLDVEVPAGWVWTSSRGLWGGDALLLSTAPLEKKPKPKRLES